jgi:hypothetical protein
MRILLISKWEEETNYWEEINDGPQAPCKTRPEFCFKVNEAKFWVEYKLSGKERPG